MIARAARTLDRFDPARGWFLAVAVLAFTVGAIIAVTSLDVRTDELRLGPMVLLLVFSIPTIALAAAEYRASAALLGIAVDRREAVRVALTSTAANLLPLPGGALVRTQSLRHRGSRGGSAFAAQLVMALAWLSLAGLAGGGTLVVAREATAVPFIAVGLAAALAAASITRRLAERDWLRVLVAAAVVELGFVVNASIRMYLAIAALGIDPTISQGVVLAASSVLSAFAAVFPAGLGIRELLAAGLAPLVGLDPAVGFLAAALVRAITMIGYAPVTLAAWISRRRNRPQA